MAGGSPATPASAQIAARIGIASDYRPRSYSLSGGRPVAMADLAYEHPDGIYANAATVTVLRRQGPALMHLQGNIGYARRLTSALALDAGVLRSHYFRSFSGERNARYTEAYIGLATRRISSRIYVSPDYFQPGVWTTYAEIEATITPATHWSLNGHLGALTYLSQPSGFDIRSSQIDWRVGVTREAGAAALYVALSGGGPGQDYYDQRYHDRTALLVGASYAF